MKKEKDGKRKINVTMEELGIRSIDEYFSLLTHDDANKAKIEKLLGIKRPPACYNCKYFSSHEFTGNRYSFNSACMILGDNFPLNLEKLDGDDFIVCDRWEEEE